MKKHHTSTEHYYLPLNLVLLNICLIHFLFALSSGQAYTTGYKFAVGAGLLALALSVVGKSRWAMLAAALFYLLVLFVTGTVIAPGWIS